MLDAIFTLHWWDLFGEMIELNPIGVYILSHQYLLYIKIIVSAVVLVFLDTNSNRGIYNVCRWVLCLSYLLLAIYHLAIFIVAR